jgi:PAS domain S-box-containing protein
MNFYPRVKEVVRGGVSRHFVLLLFLFSLIPMAILTAVFFSFYYKGQLEWTGNVEREVADRISSSISAYLEKTADQIQLFARQMNPEIQSKRELEYLAYDFLDRWNEYDILTVADLQGNEIIKVSRYYTFGSENLGKLDLGELIHRISQGKPRFGQVEISRFSKLPQVLITVPIMDIKHRVTAVLQVGVNVAKMWKLISKYEIGENRYAYIVDSKGTLIAYQDISSILQKKDLRNIQGVVNFLNGIRGASTYKGFNEREVIGSNAVIRITGWGVVVEDPIKDAFHDFYVLSKIFIGIFVLTIILVLFLGFQFGLRKIIRPIRRLQEESNIIARGDLEHRIQISRSDELGQLAESFNRMVENLQKTTVSRDLLVQEIGERKRAEEALMSERAQLLSIFDSINQVIYIADPHTFQILYVNKALRDAFQKDPVGGICYREFQGLDSPCAFCTNDVILKDRKKPYEWEYHNPILQRDFMIIDRIMKWPDGRDVRFEMAIDIHERKKAERALRESEEKYRTLVEESFDGIFIQKGPKIIFANKRLNEMLRYGEGELIGQNHWVVYHPDYQKLTRERAQARMRGEEPLRRYEVKLQRKDGSWFYGEVNAQAITFEPDEERGIQVWIKDIMEQKLAEKSLRENEERYRELINSITDFIYSHDLDGRFLSINPAAAKTLGYAPEDLIGHAITDFLPLEYESSPTREYLEHIKEKGSSEGVTISVAKDGSKHYIEYRSVLVKKEGMEAFVTGSGRDITERVLSERKVQALREQLHRAQKMESMGLMAGGVAHDLNNILSGIVSYPELLLMDLPEESPLRKPIETIKESGMRAADVVADLMTIARGVASSKEVLNLNTVVEEYLKSVEHQKLERTHAFVNFKTELEPDLLNMSGSPTHIKKTLMNLVTNASEAIEGSGTVVTSTLNRYLDEPLQGYEDVRMGEYTVLIVSDNGSGILPQDLERIFEPFYTKKVMGRSGTGLGLAVVWNTVQDHNGYVNVNTSEKGTVFELYFPVTREELADKREGVPLEDYQGHGEKILVVDDEERQREIASRMLTKVGYNTEAVSSGEEAIRYVKENPVDLIVLDMVMPKGINGRETYEEIIKIRPGQKAVIASGYAKTKEVDIAQKLGAGKYIKKPYTLEKIGIAVKKELER